MTESMKADKNGSENYFAGEYTTRKTPKTNEKPRYFFMTVEFLFRSLYYFLEVRLTDNINIRVMREEDKSSVRNFFDCMGEKSASFFNVGHGNERRVMGSFDGSVTGHIFFVAETGGTVVGIMFIWDIDKSVPWFGIAVRDGMQGRGVGTAMMKYIMSFCREHGCGGLLLRTAKANVGAQHLYEKSGFERLGEHPSGELLYLRRFDTEEIRA